MIPREGESPRKRGREQAPGLATEHSTRKSKGVEVASIGPEAREDPGHLPLAPIWRDLGLPTGILERPGFSAVGPPPEACLDTPDARVVLQVGMRRVLSQARLLAARVRSGSPLHRSWKSTPEVAHAVALPTFNYSEAGERRWLMCKLPHMLATVDR
jgi:hypothetical protein